MTGGFLLVLAWLNYADTQGLLPLALTACALHELGHCLAVTLLGGRVTGLRLTAAGAEMRLSSPLSYGRELLYTLAGPAVNMSVALLAAQGGTDRAMLFSGLNFVLGGFNLLPMSRMDGGRALYCILALATGQERAIRAGEWLDLVMAGGFLLLGAAAIWAGGNFTLLLVGVWAAVSCSKTCENLYSQSQTTVRRKKALARRHFRL